MEIGSNVYINYLKPVSSGFGY